MRPCAFPGCDGSLTNLVPEHIIHCTICQIIFAQWCHDFEEEIIEREDLLFIFHHQDGCWMNELADLLQIPRGTFREYMVKGRLPGKKKVRGPKESWWIYYEGLVEAIVLVRNWIPINRELAKKVKTDMGILRQYAKNGYFGETKESLQGYLSIHMAFLPTLEERCAKIRGKRILKRGKPRHYLQSDEMTPGAFAKRYSTSYEVVYYWINKGMIKARKIKTKKCDQKILTRLAIKASSFWTFTKKVALGKYNVQPYYVDRSFVLLKEIYGELPKRLQKMVDKATT